MDSIELNKIAAAVLCAGAAAFAADRIGAGLAAVQPPAEVAFVISGAPGSGGGPGAVPAAPSITALLRTASVAHGEAYAAAQCSACHSFTADGPTIVGPNLHSVAGARVAGVAGYDYSDALQHAGGRWTPERLDSWLTRPASFAPGTKMGFVGITDPGTRADTVAYLISLSHPPAAPAPADAKPAATPAAAPTATPAAATAPSPEQIKAGSQIAAAQCSSCHSFDKGGDAMIGPNLYGVVGRPIAGDASYSYSAALSAHHGPWTTAALDAWLLKPRAFAPGTKMGYPGLPSADDRSAVIAYLHSLSDAH